MKNSNEPIGNRTRYFLARSAVPLAKAPPRTLIPHIILKRNEV